MAKRAFDILAALAGLILLSPLLAGIALAVRLGSPGPALHWSSRVGRFNAIFKMPKFRTMQIGAPNVATHLLPDPDAWITPLGRFLRRSSLDELPQLWNVLKGEMRLVGPRPITLGELDRYGEARWHYLNAMPGMTGLWQVSGRSDTTYEERVELDRDYVEQRSLWSDAVILLKTIAVVLGKGGAR